jgi:DNA-binding response OmpR family regulator
MRILLVHNNEQYRRNLKIALEQKKYIVDDVSDPISGVEHVGKNRYDLAISALDMELMDGNRFLCFVRQVQTAAKTIVLAAQPSVISEIEAIENNVDYYLNEALHLDVLLKYVDHLLQEKKSSPDKFYSDIDDICLDVNARTIHQHGAPINLTNKEFGILYMLLANKGKAIQRAEFVNELWDKRFEEVEERVIDVHIKVIRQKLNTSCIVAVRGYGYKWDE